MKQGTVVGCREPLPLVESLKRGSKSTFQRFSGIPYAHPPIEKLRFRAPKKLERFETDEIDCTKDKDACYQKGLHGLIGSEDCLYLNVFVPDSRRSSVQKLPVMFYIHGGEDFCNVQ